MCLYFLPESIDDEFCIYILLVCVNSVFHFAIDYNLMGERFNEF